jgi:signal transduction histidine kinase
LRSDFVSSVSHELRTPLAQILLYGETLALGRTRSDEARRQAAETIVEEARRLIRMVENILQLSRASRATPAGSTTGVQVASIEIGALVQSVVTGFEPLARRAGIRLESEVDPAIHALADPQCTRQILLNLLDNALTHGPTDQTVKVGASRNNGVVRLWVEDQGTGISPAEREKVFERFVRGSGSTGSGAGIGLAVVKELAALQGGRVWVEDGAEGGAKFVVELGSHDA